LTPTAPPPRPVARSRGLIITADDFGMALSVNEAVERAHRDGVLSAASLMVRAPASADAVERAKRLADLRVGLHLVLVDGLPVLPASEVPHLVDGDGRFRAGMVAAGATMFFHPAARRELAAEIEAQFQAFRATGLRLDHVNAHKHFHLHPTIAGLILRIGARRGVRAVRFPVEPVATLNAVETDAGFRSDPLLDAWARLGRARLRRAGMLAPDQVFGLRWSGQMHAERLEGLIRALPPGLSEIYLHPAVDGGFVGAAPGYAYEAELAALLSPGVANALSESGARRGGFADFSR
jgi:hopanoid biosynthesis associated protein HpnK